MGEDALKLATEDSGLLTRAHLLCHRGQATPLSRLLFLFSQMSPVFIYKVITGPRQGQFFLLNHVSHLNIFFTTEVFVYANTCHGLDVTCPLQAHVSECSVPDRCYCLEEFES